MNEMSEFLSNIADYISKKILDEVLIIPIFDSKSFFGPEPRGK